jgi:hypothetical protein
VLFNCVVLCVTRCCSYGHGRLDAENAGEELNDGVRELLDDVFCSEEGAGVGARKTLMRYKCTGSLTALEFLKSSSLKCVSMKSNKIITNSSVYRVETETRDRASECAQHPAQHMLQLADSVLKHSQKLNKLCQ